MTLLRLAKAAARGSCSNTELKGVEARAAGTMMKEKII